MRQAPSLQKASPAKKQREPLILREDVAGKGRGVFAGRAFHAGEEVLEFFGERRDVSAFPDLTHALQVGPREFLSSSGGVDDFVNHSCEPNCGITETDGRIVLIALKDLKNGEEITFDYSTTQAGGFWVMGCQCGTAACRGNIGDFSDLSPVLQAFYIKRRAVLPFLIK